MARHREAGLSVAARAEGLETVRTLAWLLPQEVAVGREGLDWRVVDGDSLELRAFRGTALVETGSIKAQRFRVCYRGIRGPIPEKDSVLLLSKDGSWTVHDLEYRISISSRCGGLENGSGEEWTLSPGRSDALLARLFERGSYHLTGGALRYRRGDGGRQPLTPEKIRRGRFMGSAERGNPFAWEIVLHHSPPGRTEDRPGPTTLSWRGGGS